MNSSYNKDVFYVLLWPDKSAAINGTHLEVDNLISQDRNKIMDFCKKNKGARFKCFNSYQEAFEFLINLDQSNNDYYISSNLASPNLESPFPSLQTPGLNEFQRMIKANNLSAIQSMVDTNPGYLISFSSNRPTIFKGTAHYNAVHMAIWFQSPLILEYILKTIDSPSFIKRCFPNEASINDRRDYFLDLFLNTVDPISCNTPLHFACKNSDLQSIAVLLDYVPLIKVDCVNKFGQQPRNLVKDPILKVQIEQMLDSCLFVAIVRSYDDLDAQIKKPSYGRRSVNLKHTYDDSSSRVSTIVGPMSPDLAKALYQTLKSSMKCDAEQRSIRLKDPMRGVEKVAHHLSFKFAVPCQEYWSFLGDYIDFSSVAGFNRLETHLQSQHNHLVADLVHRRVEAMLKETELKPCTFYDESGSTGGIPMKSVNGLNSDLQSKDEQQQQLFNTPPTTPTNEKIQVQQFYLTGDMISGEDKDVLTRLELAIEQGVFHPFDDSFKWTYPFLCHWFCRMKANAN